MTSMIIGMPADQIVAFVESRLGSLDDLPMPLYTQEPAQDPRTATAAFLGQWCYDHPATPFPSSSQRDQTRQQIAALERQLTRRPTPRRTIQELAQMVATTRRLEQDRVITERLVQAAAARRP